ncbi:ABC transporter substrate-binding protein [Intestinimonas butyriciproducens]|uniref:Iron complex transport system substrate-binding protein n=1 Tax=Intestinimonas butyriciproducens TaxID=1297617 RepID=A0A2U1CF27_9FIRM|nr:ABC transporter substrate-binding protein [Intestinimonas butyriciproducens]SCJ81394.1 ferrichrome/ferrioxamine B periplasmic transporter [uncultured Clostridium sp.]MCI6364636.1 ABC transporter substrate-binding protein [Intestinimonas butyriciproducens]MCR1905029.1 ABC transporter substrate-binding protein [Intestinimonas butyriciproducens]MDB7829985.1 ABC transporter substrate-binding protein [Intestinimonas butyriciproducens]MDB7861546.1 ABC transporter substrate-binding protein [Intest
MKRTLALFLALTLSLSLLAGCGGQEAQSTPAPTGTTAPTATPDAEEPTTKVVVDGLGREVEIPWPVERAVVANRYNSELIRACGAIDRVIAVDTNTAQDRVYWSQFDPDNVIGKGQSELNYEKIVDLGAQVLITPKNGTYEQDQEMLEPFGIKVLVVTGWDNADLVNQIEAVGRIFDVEEKAAELRAFYEENQQKLDACLANVAEKKTVYWEYGDPYTTCIPGTSNDGWHNMLVSAGAINIFGDESLAGKDIDPEAILLADPDLIIKTSSGPALKNTGVYTPPTQEMYEEITAEMVSRPGWSDLKAVQNKNLYCTTGFCAGGLGKLIGALYTATWLYPDECADIDPDAVFDEWMSMQEVGPIEGHVYRLP